MLAGDCSVVILRCSQGCGTAEAGNRWPERPRKLQDAALPHACTAQLVEEMDKPMVKSQIYSALLSHSLGWLEDLGWKLQGAGYSYANQRCAIPGSVSGVSRRQKAWWLQCTSCWSHVCKLWAV